LTGTLTMSNFTQDVSIILRLSRVLPPTLALLTCSPGGTGVPLSASPFNLVLQFHYRKVFGRSSGAPMPIQQRRTGSMSALTAQRKAREAGNGISN